MATNTSADMRPPQRGPVQDERDFQSLFDAEAQAMIEGRRLSFGLRMTPPDADKVEALYLTWPPAARAVALNNRPRP